MLRILHFSNISMLPVLKLVSFDILNLVCGILILGRQLVCVISMQSILKTLGFFSSAVFPSVAVQSLPTRTTQYARYSDSDSPTLYPQALLIPSLISLARPVQQKTTNSLEGRGPHSSSFSPLRMANKGPDAMAFKQVFNTVYFNFKLASCPTQSPSAGAVHGGVLGIGPVDASARVCLPSRFLLLNFLGAGTGSPPMSICWSSCGSMVAKSGP